MRPSGQDTTALYALAVECHHVSLNQSLGFLVRHANIVGQKPEVYQPSCNATIPASGNFIMTDHEMAVRALIATWVSGAATALATLILGWYTVETWRLRKTAEHQLEEAMKTVAESQRQTENALMPVLTLTVEQRQPGAPMMAFFFRNIGHGPAFNVNPKIEVQGTNLTFQIATFPSVLPNDRSIVEFRMGLDPQLKRIETQDLVVTLRQAKRPILIDVTYRAVTGKKYFTRHSVEIDEGFIVQFVEHKTV